MGTELIPLENPEPQALFVPGGLESILVQVEMDARALVPDLSTVSSRAAIAANAMRVARTKTYLDGLGKDYVAVLKDLPRQVDAERKAMRDRLDALKEEVRRPLTEWEQKESDRVDGIRSRVDLLRRTVYDGQPAAYYATCLAEIEEITVDASFAEFEAEAQQAKDASCFRLAKLRDQAAAREAAEAKAEADRKAADAAAQKEREERIAKEAAERATREAEQKAKAAQEAAQSAQKQAEQRAKEAEARAVKEAAFAKVRQARAIKEEQERAAAARRAQEEADAQRAADQAHRERITNEIWDDVTALSSDGCPWPTDIIDAISAGKIRHLKIIY